MWLIVLAAVAILSCFGDDEPKNKPKGKKLEESKPTPPAPKADPEPAS